MQFDALIDLGVQVNRGDGRWRRDNLRSWRRSGGRNRGATRTNAWQASQNDRLLAMRWVGGSFVGKLR